MRLARSGLSDHDLDSGAVFAESMDHLDLVVSLNTVRSHTKAIFAKLGVNSRRAAVRRASDLDLLTHSRS